MSDQAAAYRDQQTILGHPVGLFTLFFAEMWERFSYYGMRALLTLYMIKGFLGYGDSQAYEVYGAYTAMVYMTPFIGGLLADRILGRRLAVVIGGVLMAAGHLLMTVESEWPFFFALALLICGNGLFKPNVSTIVGSLYKPGSPRRDDGFNVFYMGINLGAAMAPLLCGYVGETYGWHYGFGLATIGMMIGLAVFVMPTRVTQVLVGSGATASALGMVLFRPDNVWAIAINIFIALALVASAGISCLALRKGGLPSWAGARPEEAPRNQDWMVYLGIAIAIPVFALLVCGFSPFLKPEQTKQDNAKKRMKETVAFLDGFGIAPELIEKVKKSELRARPVRGSSYQVISEGSVFSIKMGFAEETFEKLEKAKVNKRTLQVIKSGKQGRKKNREQVIADLKKAGVSQRVVDEVMAGGGAGRQILGVFIEQMSKPAGLVLTVLGLLAFGYLFFATFQLETKPRERMLAALTLIFFQMLFFAFFEQAGSSLTNFTDRNVDRVSQRSTVTEDMVGTTVRIQPTQEQLGFKRSGKLFTMGDLDKLRKLLKSHDPKFEIDWKIEKDNIGMGIAEKSDELAASSFQAVNPTYILIFALVFNWIWSKLRAIGWEPNAGIKFSLGLLQLGLGFGAFWLGAQSANDRGMVNVTWLLLGYLFHTTGELCLSPVGLSVMTKLAPKVLVSTLMGSWFLATAFSQYLAAIISQFTGVGEGGGDELPIPKDTVNIYGDVFGQVAIVSIICALICLAISPILKRWMHLDDLGGG